MHAKRGARPLRRAEALRRLVVVLPPRGRLLRQGHPRHHPRALVRQGRDVQLLPARGGRRPSTCGCSQWEEEFLQALELPYRVVDIAAGDLGTSAARKYDIEAWFPSQGTYRELTSTSDCTTFQARRLTIRYRDADGKPQTAATLNGTLCAIARTIACLLEVHQRADGSVHVPGRAAAVARRRRDPHPGDDAGRAASRRPHERLRRPKALKAYGVLPDADRVIDLGDRDLGRRGGRSSSPPTSTARCSTAAGEVSPRTRAALTACWDAGIPVVGVTGRGPRLLDSVREALAGRGIAVLAQGGYVVDLERNEVLRTVGLPRRHRGGGHRAHRGGRRRAHRRRRGRRRAGRGRSPRCACSTASTGPIPSRRTCCPATRCCRRAPCSRCSCGPRPSGQDELLALARTVVDPVEAEVTHAGLGFIEVLPPGVTKATGLAVALERYGVDLGDVLVFGDMPNDLPMIERGAGGRRPRGRRGQRPPVGAGGGRRSSPAGTTSTASRATWRRVLAADGGPQCLTGARG